MENKKPNPIYVKSKFSRHIVIKCRFSPIIRGEAQFRPEISVKFKNTISLRQKFRKEIAITQQFDLNPKELAYMYDMVGDKYEQRKAKIARLFFSMGVSVKEISDSMGLSKSAVYDAINVYKKDVLDTIKTDLRKNKKILGHMVQLMAQTEQQIRILWGKYDNMESDSKVIRAGLIAAYDVVKAGKPIDGLNVRDLTKASRAALAIQDRQLACLDLLGKKTRQMLEIWDKFGLTGEDAIKVIFSGGIDVDVKIQEIKMVLLNFTEIIKEEVKDKNIQHRVFGRMAKRISNSGIGKEYEDYEKDMLSSR